MISPPPSPPSGPEVNDPVGCFDHIQVVLDHYHGIAVVAQPMQDFQQQVDILEMEVSGGFIQNIEGAAGIAF